MQPSAQLERVREIQHEIASMPRGKGASDERKQKFEALRAEQERLSESERKEARKDMGRWSSARGGTSTLLAYVKMSQSEKTRLLDEKIARELEIQKKIDAGADQSRRPGGPGGRQRSERRSAGRGRTVKGRMTASFPEDRDGFRRDMLIHTSPEARAAMDQMRTDMATRRVQKGLPPQPTFGKGRVSPRHLMGKLLSLPSLGARSGMSPLAVHEAGARPLGGMTSIRVGRAEKQAGQLAPTRPSFDWCDSCRPVRIAGVPLRDHRAHGAGG